MKGTAHLLHGFAGAGKTTFARRLEQQRSAVRFTHDEWKHKLYGENPTGAECADLFARVDGLIWQHALRLLDLGVDVILDHGFWSRQSRDQARWRVGDLGAQAVLYRIQCSQDEMERRVSRRTKDVPCDSLWINQAAVDEFKTRFEPLGSDEDHVEIDGTQNRVAGR